MMGPLLVLAPHPDDELLGAAGLMARQVEAGGTVGVVVATDGSRSDPNVPAADLAALRRAECRAGLERLLGPCPPLLFLEAPDGALDAARIDLSPDSPLARFVGKLQPGTILAPDPADAHPDHKAAFGLAARLISAGHGHSLHAMPIGRRVDGGFDPAGYTAMPVGQHTANKAAALACHASQLLTDTGFSLSPAILADFAETEYLRLVHDRTDMHADAVAAAHFDALFEGSPDPWGYDEQAYEQDRFRRTVTALSDRRYAHALELGCANGALTARLAPLCERLIATDTSRSALALAQARLKGRPNVVFQRCRLPDEIPSGPFDLIVASDLLYYLGLEGVVALMRGLDARAGTGSRLFIASYLGETDTRLTGEMASEIALAHLAGWYRVHAERTERLRIDVLDKA